MNLYETKTIESDRLILRKFNIKDAEAMFNNWASDEEVTKYLTWPPHESVKITEEILHMWIEDYNKKNSYQWAIVLKSNGDEPIGCIGTVDINENINMAHIGYCIGRKWWHKGITSEALKMVISFLFEETHINRIESRHDPHNPNSGAVMKKCGMKYEGTMRQADRNNQGIVDASYYAILRSDFKEK